jgi:hypothetical protein
MWFIIISWFICVSVDAIGHTDILLNAWSTGIVAGCAVYYLSGEGK